MNMQRCSRWLAILVLSGLTAACAATQTAPPTPTEGDLAALASATQAALENAKTGESRNWVNDATGHRGTVTPLATETKDDGTPCREYQQSFTADGITQVAYGTACRRESGDWETTDYTGFRKPGERAGRARPSCYDGYYWHHRYYGAPYCRPYHGSWYWRRHSAFGLGYYHRF